jgi:serine/threonine protein kinase
VTAADCRLRLRLSACCERAPLRARTLLRARILLEQPHPTAWSRWLFRPEIPLTDELSSRRHLILPLRSKETPVLFKSKDEATGKSLVNQYLILDELGRGQHGKVRLARDVNDGSYWVRCHPPPLGGCLRRLMFASTLARADDLRPPHTLVTRALPFDPNRPSRSSTARQRRSSRRSRRRPAPSPSRPRSRRRTSPSARPSLTAAHLDCAQHLRSCKRADDLAPTLRSRLRKEIAILKKLRHEHVVRLREVIDAPSSKYIFLGESPAMRVS